jgi:Na+/H+ antiporter NhaD/arsenite permease-like protein
MQVEILGLPMEYILFGLTLLGIAFFHNHSFRVALIGLMVVSVYKIALTGFKSGPGLIGFLTHIGHEWVTLANLFSLILGFAILARHFEKSHVPVILPKFLPSDWKGGFALLAIVFVISSFLDNIAAALIGGAMAHQLFRARVHIAFVAAIVAASNAGGAWSVVGDTTTTMMWIHGVSPVEVLRCFGAALFALFVFGVPAARTQHRYSPIIKNAHSHTQVDWPRMGIVFFILLLAMTTNVLVNQFLREESGAFPYIGAAVWLAILMTIPVRRHDWELIPQNMKGTCFLLALVAMASMMPVDSLPAPSWQSAMGLGAVSAMFDNIPLTALALKQGGYDWGFLAYAVGFGGSMLWFGSSAGVALSNMYPEARSVGLWLRHGWPIAVAYVLSYLLMLVSIGWNPV